MRIGIVLPELNLGGDAVGNDALGMYQTLVDHGVETRIFVAAPSTSSNPKCGTYGEIDNWLEKDGVLIYHYASIDRYGLDVLRKSPAKKVIRYHNVTPGHFFHKYSSEVEAATNEARELLKDFLTLPRCYGMSDSAFNSEELIDLGLPKNRASIVPPFHRIEELTSQAFLERDSGFGSTFNILTVGRIAPNKRADLLIECFADVLEKTDKNVMLNIVGNVDPRLGAYKADLDTVVAHRRLGGKISFIENVSPAGLASLYANTSLFVTCSDHEGFCVPVVEAMAFKKPVVASTRAALPETCGGAAVLCSDRASFVDAILHFINDEADLMGRGLRGRSVYEGRYTQDIIRRRFLRELRRTTAPLGSRIDSLIENAWRVLHRTSGQSV